MRRFKGLGRVLMILGLVVAGTVVTATPAMATVVTTCSSLCFSVDGSGNYMYKEGVRINSDPRFYVSNYGHLQARWRSGGVDRYRNSTQGYITNQETRWLNLNVTVDPYTYVCGRFWRWNGSSWILPYGNWQCIKTHP
jgi:hypothetical protein